MAFSKLDNLGPILDLIRAGRAYVDPCLGDIRSFMSNCRFVSQEIESIWFYMDLNGVHIHVVFACTGNMLNKCH